MTKLLDSRKSSKVFFSFLFICVIVQENFNIKSGLVDCL